MDDIPEMPDEEPFPEFEPALKRMMVPISLTGFDVLLGRSESEPKI